MPAAAHAAEPAVGQRFGSAFGRARARRGAGGKQWHSVTHSRDGEVVHGVLPLGKETARRHGGRDGSGQQRAQRAQRNSDRLHGHTSRAVPAALGLLSGAGPTVTRTRVCPRVRVCGAPPGDDRARSRSSLSLPGFAPGSFEFLPGYTPATIVLKSTSGPCYLFDG